MIDHLFPVNRYKNGGRAGSGCPPSYNLPTMQLVTAAQCQGRPSSNPEHQAEYDYTMCLIFKTHYTFNPGSTVLEKDIGPLFEFRRDLNGLLHPPPYVHRAPFAKFDLNAVFVWQVRHCWQVIQLVSSILCNRVLCTVFLHHPPHCVLCTMYNVL